MDPTPEKAKKMLRSGTANGKPLTHREKRYLRFVGAGGKSHRKNPDRAYPEMAMDDEYMSDYMMPPQCVHTPQGGTVRTEFTRMKGKGDQMPVLEDFDSHTGDDNRESLTEEYRG